MAKAQQTQNPFGTGHEESASDFHRRVQDQIDEDSWIGRSTVAANFPERAIVHDIGLDEGKPHVYRIRKP